MISRLENRSRDEADSPAGFQEIVKRAWFQRYRWFFTADDMIAIGGRDSSSNSAVIRKHLEKERQGVPRGGLRLPVLHPEGFGGGDAGRTERGGPCDGVFQQGVEGGDVRDERILGDARPESKRRRRAGSSCQRAPLSSRGRENFVKIASLKLAVGIVRYNDGHVLTCGPPGPVKRQSVCYAVIEPASGDMAEAGKKVKWEFTKVHEEEAKAIPLDEFVRVLPAGGSHITELGDGQNAGIR